MYDCALEQPGSPDTRIWRYINFAKLVLLFETRTLFFPLTTKLQDAMEGGGSAAEPRVAPVSSWHISDHESQAMWRLYSPLQEAIAICSTYGRLQKVLPRETAIYQVRYLDEVDPDCARRNPLFPFFIKRRAFEHEKELRAVVPMPPGAQRPGERGPEGYAVPVDLDLLLDKVLVSPTAPDWLADLVIRLGRRYEVAAPVERSVLTGTLRTR